MKSEFIHTDRERIQRIGELFSLAAERYWRAERIAGRPFVGKNNRQPVVLTPLDFVTEATEQNIVRFLMARIEATPRELQHALGISRAALTRKIARLRAVGLVVVAGRTRLARYALRGPDTQN